MKLITIFSFLTILNAGLFFNECFQTQNLYEFIGLNTQNSRVKDYFAMLGQYKIVKYSDKLSDYRFENSGIQFRVNNDGIVNAIFCYNKNPQIINQSVAFNGELPFGINFKSTLEEIQNKIGKGIAVNSYGFYGRTYQWTVQDSLKINMEVTLPKNDKEKMFINWINFYKLN